MSREKMEAMMDELVSSQEGEVRKEFALRNKSVEEQEGAIRYNEGKTDWNLMHWPSMEHLIRVLKFGEKKYGRLNYMKGHDQIDTLNSLTRHIAAMHSGELYDKETGELHAAHGIANCMFWIYNHIKDNQKSVELGKVT
jgi:IS5 family transposase